MISSLLDNDMYAWTMSQLIERYFIDHNVRYAFKNRTLSVRLTDTIDIQELNDRLQTIRELRYRPAELEFLRNTGVLDNSYLDSLTTFRLPEVEVQNIDGWLSIEYEGSWKEAIFWETPILATVNELHFDALRRQERRSIGDVRREGHKRLAAKLDVLRQHSDIKFLEMGTRRRYAGWWQDSVIARTMAGVPKQLLGTSNALYGKMYDLPVSGTMAHQLFMVLAAMYSNPEAAQIQVLQRWVQMYGGTNLMTALPDTFTTDFFLRHVTNQQLGWFSRLRQDSGNPIAIGDKFIQRWEQAGIDPMEKGIVFSDSLDVNAMISIAYHFQGRVPYSFGVGTNLTNDVSYSAVSTVIKPCAVDGLPTVKISDDLSKATGDKDLVAKYIQLSEQ
jgi:nicotinate phosphoribosyltransferase